MSPISGTDAAKWLAWRAIDAASSLYASGGDRVQDATTNETSQASLNLLRFAAAKSIRTSTIILAIFNTVTAFATAVGILYDTYTRAKRNNQRYQFSRQGFQFVPVTEVYPLILSLGIVIQGTMFAYAQSNGLDGLFARGCILVSQFMLPAVLLVPFIQVVFAIETALRGLRKKPFQPRGKWTVIMCLTTIGLLALGSFLVADFIRPSDFCFASLFWFVAKYAAGLFAVLTGIAATLLICAIVIFLRLRASAMMEVTERVNASRMVYYLALATISTTFALPFFFCLAFRTMAEGDTQTLTLSMIAAVVANVSGLMTGGLYLFLKSTTSSTIGAKHKAGRSHRSNLKYQIRRYDTHDGDHASDGMSSASGPSTQRHSHDGSSVGSNEKAEESPGGGRDSPSSWSRIGEQPPNPLRSNAILPLGSMPQALQAARASSVSTGHARKRSYSLFPNNPPSAKSSIALLPSTTYTPRTRTEDNLKPPPSMRNLMARHRRDSSMISSATVQMVLRLSSGEDMPPESNRTTTVDPDTASVYSQEAYPKELQLKRADTASSGTETAVAESEDLPDASPKRDRGRDARMKTLPPVPRQAAVDTDTSDAEETLSPTVYSPQSARLVRLPSKRDVPVGTPAVPASADSHRSPTSLNSLPPRRAADPSQRLESAKSDWI